VSRRSVEIADAEHHVIGSDHLKQRGVLRDADRGHDSPGKPAGCGQHLKPDPIGIACQAERSLTERHARRLEILSELDRAQAINQHAEMINRGSDVRVAADREIAGADFDVEPKRWIALLKELRVEDAPIEPGGRLLIGDRQAEVLDAGRRERKIVGSVRVRRARDAREGTGAEPLKQLASAGGMERAEGQPHLLAGTRASRAAPQIIPGDPGEPAQERLTADWNKRGGRGAI
jgi:hypothetical protein